VKITHPIALPICRQIAEYGVSLPVGFASGATNPDLATLKAKAVSLWTQDEASGNLLDLIGSNHQVVSGTVTREAGKVGNCTRSTSGYTDTAANTGLFPVNASFTFCIWIKFGATGFQGICGRLDESNCWGLRTSFSEKMQFCTKTAGSDTVVEFGSLTADQWIFVIVEYDHAAQEIRGRVNNGTPVVVSKTDGTGATSGSFQFHQLAGSAAAGDMSIDEPGMYSGILTESEIAAVWNAGSGISNTTIAAA